MPKLDRSFEEQFVQEIERGKVKEYEKKKKTTSSRIQCKRSVDAVMLHSIARLAG